MAMTSTVKTGQAIAQSGKPLPNTSNLPSAVRSDLEAGYGLGKK